MRATAAFVCLSAFVCLFSFADIPDRVNTEKFKTLFEAQKTLSDTARQKANSKQADYDKARNATRELRSRKTTLEAGVKENQKQTATYQNQIKQLDAQVEQLNKTIAENQLKITQLDQEIQSLDTDIKNKDQEVAQQSTSTATAQATRDQANQDLAAQKQALENVIATLQAQRAEKENLTTEIDALKGRIRQLKLSSAKLEQDRLTSDAAIKQLRDDQSNLKAIVVQDRANRANLETQRDNTQTRVTALSQDWNRRSEVSADLSKKLEEADRRVENDERRRQTNERELNQIAVSLNDKGRQFQALDQRKMQLAREIDQGNNLSAKKQGEWNQAENARKATSIEEQRLNKTTEDFRLQSENIRARHTALGQEVDQFHKLKTDKEREATNLKTRRETTAKELTDVQSQKNTLTAQKSALEKQTGGTPNEQAARRAQIQALQTRITTLDARVSPLQNSIAQTDRTLAQTNRDIVDANQKRDQAAKNQSALKPSLDAAVKQYSDERTKLGATRQSLSNLTTQTTQLGQEINTLVAGVKRDKQALNVVLADMQTVQATLTALGNDQRTAKDRLDKADEQLKLSHQTRGGFRRQFAENKKELEEVGGRLAKRQEELAQIKSGLQTFDRAIADKESKVSEYDQLITQEGANLRRIAIDQQRIANAIPKHETDVTTKDTQRGALDQKIADKLVERGEVQERVRNQQTKTDDAEQVYRTEKGKWEQGNRELTALKSNQATKQKLSTDLRDATTNAQATAATAKADAKAAADQIDVLANQITKSQTDIADLETQITTAENVETIQEGAFKLADGDAKDEEKRTTAALDTYRKVKAQYDREREIANNDGARDGTTPGAFEGETRAEQDGATEGKNQGTKLGEEDGEKRGRVRDYQAGVKSGETKGSADGQSEGTKAGQSAGDSEGDKKGLESGFEKGLAKGAAEGAEKGYNAGLLDSKTDANYQKGLTAGTTAGLDRARKVAKKEDYLKGRKDAEGALGQGALAHKLEIDQSKSEDGKDERSLLPRLGVDPLASTEAGIAAVFFRAPADSGELPKIDYRNRKYLKTYDHPDFDAAYQQSYDSAYRDGYTASYPKMYQKKYKIAYDEAYQSGVDRNAAKEYEDEKKSGTAAGYKASYEQSYATARKAAYDLSYARSFAKAEMKGDKEKYPEGYEKGYKDGYAKGVKEGFDTIFKQGFEVGDKDAFDKNIEAERKNAYAAGKQSVLDELQKKYFLKVVGAKLNDADGDGFYKGGEKISLTLRLNNYGGIATPKGKLSVEIEDIGKTLKLATTKAVLRELPADTEATYLNVLLGEVTGEEKETALNLKVKVFEESNVIGSFNLEKKITETFSFELQALRVGSVANYWTNYFFIENKTDEDMPDGYTIAIKTNDQRVSMFNNAVKLPAIGKKSKKKFEYYVQISEAGDYRKHALDIVIKDPKGKIVYDKNWNAEISTK